MSNISENSNLYTTLNGETIEINDEILKISDLLWHFRNY